MKRLYLSRPSRRSDRGEVICSLYEVQLQIVDDGFRIVLNGPVAEQTGNSIDDALDNCFRLLLDELGPDDDLYHVAHASHVSQAIELLAFDIAPYTPDTGNNDGPHDMHAVSNPERRLAI